MNVTRAKQAKVWARDELDWYVEPQEATTALIGVEKFIGSVWDPACGQGNICEAFNRHGSIVVGTDKVRRVNSKPWFNGEFNFMCASYTLAPNIVCNPPFFRGKGTEAFIRKALSIAYGKVAVFASIKFLAGAGRANSLYAEHVPHRIWIVTPRVSCPPGEYLAGGNKAGGGTDDWCWIVWDQSAPAPAFPQLGWLRGVGKAIDGATLTSHDCDAVLEVTA